MPFCTSAVAVDPVWGTTTFIIIQATSVTYQTMPRGYYLSGPSRDYEERPRELPDGRLLPPFDPKYVLKTLEREPSIGAGWCFPTKFVPPSASATPANVFSGRKTHLRIIRYTHRNDDSKVLIRTDGACLNNGQGNPRAGWAFLHGINADSCTPLVTSGRLEEKGPFGDEGSQTSNRAELRAVIAALRFRHWPVEGFRTLVVAADSEYVVDGATMWTRTWVKNGWKTQVGDKVKNRDLWKALLGEVEWFKDEGVAIQSGASPGSAMSLLMRPRKRRLGRRVRPVIGRTRWDSPCSLLGYSA
ncbi:hypothetical protein DL771_006821 [Monosporascus sp. 5C6A]|nr:hypothetical protein DL771_006821 [Monosporascus sp. 5C6A]